MPALEGSEPTTVNDQSEEENTESAAVYVCANEGAAHVKAANAMTVWERKEDLPERELVMGEPELGEQPC